MAKDATKKKRGKSPRREKTKAPKGGKSPRRDRGTRKDPDLEEIPPEYLQNADTAEPILYFLPKAVDGSGGTGSAPGSGVTSNTKFPNLRVLLSAAEEDIRLHRARVQAAKSDNNNFLRSYKIENDELWLLRQQRLNERTLLLSKLNTERSMILKELQEPNVKGLTSQEMTQVQLARWQRALELYVYAPPNEDENEGVDLEEAEKDLEFLGLLEKLFEGITEEEDMSGILSQAADMCSTLVDVTKQIVKDSTEQVSEAEDAYQIRLEAHELFGRNALTRTEEIQNQFRINGRAATQIGNQLEFAESKRKRCESAANLIRRWRLMEQTAETEAFSGEDLNVKAEVLGNVGLASCQMDPLFTQRENSLDAARSLKQLRQVVRSRSGNATTVEKSDASVSRRFELAANLIKRTSEALEERLLNDFSETYSKGGVYEFLSKPRSGQIDWKKLRDLARALHQFGNGLNLQECYVKLVGKTRLPELFDNDAKTKAAGEEDEDDEGFEMEATKSELTNLFHRSSEVCMEEFQLIAYIFDNPDADAGMGEVIPLKIARALCTRVIGDPKNGLQARINALLDSIDRKTDFDAGATKLDTFVIIHEKASGLFNLLRESAEKLVLQTDDFDKNDDTTAVDSLKAFLNSQEAGLNNSHRLGYLNLELRLLHHECCSALDQAGCDLVPPPRIRVDEDLLEKGLLEEYRAPLLPISKPKIKKAGFNELLSGPLKQSVLRQSLIHATESLARARLMFGSGKDGGETSARAITSIYNQMCNFYGQAYLYPITEALQEMLKTSAPYAAPQLPFNEDEAAHDMGVDPAFWIALEHIHAAAKTFDREMWAQNKKGSHRVWELLKMSRDGSGASKTISTARDCRIEFFSELELRGEDAVLRALDTLNAHIDWILVAGAEAMLSSGGARLFNVSGHSDGPYAMSSGSLLEAANSPAVTSLCYCLRVQFVSVQSALTPQSLSAFWTALSMRIHDCLVTRLLQQWYVSTAGALILARDVEALRSVSTLAGTKHDHWDILRELLTLYMTPPDALKMMLIGDASSGNSGLFQTAGRDHCLVFMSRRNDFRYKTAQGMKKSIWAQQLLGELKVRDPSDGHINMGMFVAGRRG